MIDGLERRVVLETDAAISLERLAARFGSAAPGSPSASIGQIEDAVGELERRRLLMREGDSVLFLGIPVGEYQPS